MPLDPNKPVYSTQIDGDEAEWLLAQAKRRGVPAREIINELMEKHAPQGLYISHGMNEKEFEKAWSEHFHWVIEQARRSVM